MVKCLLAVSSTLSNWRIRTHMKVLGNILLEWSSVRHPVCCPDLYAWYCTGTKCFPASSEFAIV